MGTLSIEDCMCPICMCIFVEPVTMPCTHTLCMPCFKKNVEEASLTCPMCRTRISVWARRASKNRKLINEKLWIDIQSLFPDKVKKRIDGDDEEGVEVFMHPIINIAQPGEIRKEYEEQLQRLAEQREKEQQKEFEASEALIRKLQEEEEIANRMRKKEQIAIEKLDKEFAKELVNLV
ncbi:hypothetical protein KUTeg_012660 [Tegillarca granosa]|uniref:RING-type E3 ubiquitin transferase n=1 Tax=Tegillarca granosa TaxID=220873 RepID=A0ABQ9F3R0_TEGGR|nr:hypothetical protein KUTeg_012660 [Tegillarca granosa]